MKEVICPCILIEGKDINYKISFLKKLPYLGKKYYHGYIRWLLMDKKGNSISCDACGNIANGLIQSKVLGFIINIPICKSHISKYLIDKS
jgi:hypothetical protein